MNKTKQLTQGALLLSIYFAALVIDRLTVGISSSFLLYLYAIPFIIYGLNYGTKQTLTMYIAGMIATVFLAYPTSVFYCFNIVTVAVICSCLIHNKKSNKITVGVTIVVSTVITILSITAIGKLMGLDISEDIASLTDFADKWIKPMYSANSLDDEYNVIISYRVLFIISAISEAIIGIVQGIVTYLICKVVKKKMDSIKLRDS